METLRQDLRFGFRRLVQTPRFTLIAVLSLALGIGANTTIFSLVNALLLRPLPSVEDPGRLVGAYNTRQGSGYYNISYPDYAHYRDHTQAFSGLAAHWLMLLALSGNGGSEKVDGALVSGNYFSTLSLKPALGRFFLPEEDQTPDTHSVAVISHRLWQRRFGSDPGLIDKGIILNGHSFTVIGVAPAGFTGTMAGLAADVWVPTMMHSVAMPGFGGLSRGPRMLYLMVIGRLKPGVSRGQAQAEMGTLARQLEEAYPETNRGGGVILASAGGVHPAVRGAISAFFAILMGVVGLVLLIACTNVASLLLARATTRQKEIAVRLSLGASRGRIIRQLLTESVLLSLIGGGVGLLITRWSTDLLLSSLPPIGLPLALDLGLDTRILGFTLLVSLLTGIVFGLAPALQSTKLDLVGALKDEPSLGGYRKSRLRNLLVIAQVALSLVLLIGAGLFVKSLRNAQTINPGFDPANIIVLSLNADLLGYDKAKVDVLYQNLSARVESLPGVRSVSLATFVPLGSSGDSIGVTVEGHEPAPGQEPPTVLYNVVGPNYFQTLGITLLRGRAFSEQDREGAPAVAVINETMARRYWPGEEPIGKRLRIRNQSFAVVGVARNIKYRSLIEEPRPHLYFSSLQREVAQLPGAGIMQVRMAGDASATLAAIRREVQALNPHLPVFDVQPLTESMRFTLIPTQLAGSLLGASGLLALFLAAVGIYGVVGYAVSQRTREIGIRIALGAQPRDILKQMFSQGMALSLIGVAIGLVAALALTRLLSSLLYGISPLDPITFVGVSLMMIGVALLACYLPARRATKVDPMIALRYE